MTVGQTLSRRQFGAIAAALAVTAAWSPTGQAETAPSRVISASRAALPSVANAADIRDFGARADGVTNDADAVRAAIREAAGTRPVSFPDGVTAVTMGAPFALPAGAVLVGAPGRATIRVDGTGMFCVPAGDDVTLSGLRVERGGRGTDLVLINATPFAGLTLEHVTLDGGLGGSGYCHGVRLGVRGGAGARATATGFRMISSTLANLTYGLFQANDDTVVTDGVEVAGCRFADNEYTSLEFNSPKGDIRNILVTESLFTGSPRTTEVGFGVGLAHVTGATLRNNTFTDWPGEAVHIEDDSSAITVQDNDFARCGLERYAHVQIIAGSDGVRVAGNRFDARMNTEPVALVNALQGGAGLTAGGRPLRVPSNVTVDGNTMHCSASTTPVFFEAISGGVITNNRISGPDLDEDTAFDLGGGEAHISGNTFERRLVKGS